MMLPISRYSTNNDENHDDVITNSMFLVFVDSYRDLEKLLFPVYLAIVFVS